MSSPNSWAFLYWLLWCEVRLKMFGTLAWGGSSSKQLWLCFLQSLKTKMCVKQNLVIMWTKEWSRSGKLLFKREKNDPYPPWSLLFSSFSTSAALLQLFPCDLRAPRFTCARHTSVACCRETQTWFCCFVPLLVACCCRYTVLLLPRSVLPMNWLAWATTKATQSNISVRIWHGDNSTEDLC